MAGLFENIKYARQVLSRVPALRCKIVFKKMYIIYGTMLFDSLMRRISSRIRSISSCEMLTAGVSSAFTSQGNDRSSVGE